MSSTHLIVRDYVAVNAITITPETVQQWHEAGLLADLYPGAELIDVGDLDPQPGIGWRRTGSGWTPPPPPPPEPSAAAQDEAGEGAQEPPSAT